MKELRVVGIALALLLTGCGRPQGQGPLEASSAPPSSGPKRLVAALQGELKSFYPGVVPSGLAVFTSGVHPFVNTGLTVKDDQGILQPRLAEVAPTLENGLWQVFPDGRMEITWKIREGAQWQDGTPFTTNDLLFTLTVMRDPELPFSGNLAWKAFESAQASDARSITARWKRTFINADNLLGTGLGSPLPKHIVEPFYTEQKDRFLDLPYWTEEYMGAGPFKLANWIPGSEATLAANDHYVLGRPKIDEIIIKMIPNGNTLVANILSGVVELTLAQSLSLEQAIQVRDSWKDGLLVATFRSWIRITPQLTSPNPPLVADPRLRRALVMAIDRQEMADSLYFGLSQVADAPISPDEPEFKDVQASIVRYPYDPQRAIRQLEEIGYGRGADGSFRDAAGQPLSFEFRSSAIFEIQSKSHAVVLDYWQRLGLAAEPVIIPPQRLPDAEYRATYPAFELLRYPIDLPRLSQYHSSQNRTPERNFIGGNYMRYVNPEWDGLLERYFSTVPKPERTQVLGQIMRHITDQLIMAGLTYEASSYLVTKRLQGYTAQAQGWNAYAWDLT